MENKVVWFRTPKNTPQTKRVFTKNHQVFLRNENRFSGNSNHVEIWYPINFQWIPVMGLSESLK